MAKKWVAKHVFKHEVMDRQRHKDPQGSILSPLFPLPYSVLIYINKLSKNLNSAVKFFAENTSIFHVVKDLNTSAEILNHDVSRISEWEYRWKMSFNPKQANKATKTNHPIVTFNGNTVQNSVN